MSSLLSATEKAALITDFQSLVDTFVRPFVAYHEAEKLVMVSQANYSRLNRFNQNQTAIRNTPVEQTIQARVRYEDEMNAPFGQIQKDKGDAQNKVRMANGRVRIKVDEDGYNFMLKAKKIELDGNLFDIVTVERPHGLFVPNFYTFWCERAQ